MKKVFGSGIFALVVLLLVAGCQTVGLRPPTEDTLTVVSIEPEVPVELQHGEKLTVGVRYELATAEEAIVLVRPYTNGKQSEGYVAHAAIPVRKGRGEVAGWFTFRGEARVDEIRVTLVSLAPKKLLTSVTLPVEAVWSAGAD